MLTTLNLGANSFIDQEPQSDVKGMGSLGALAIAHALRVNTVLSTLMYALFFTTLRNHFHHSLSEARIGTQGAIFLAEGLKVNQSLAVSNSLKHRFHCVV